MSIYRRVLGIGAVILILGGVMMAAWLLRPHWTPEPVSQGEWTCSMHPQVRQPGPGQCPICGMNLVPVARLSQEQAELEQRAGLETAVVAFRELSKEIRTVGKLDYNERQVAYITARIAGRVDRLYADFTGIQVKKGDHLVEIYSPELYVAQGELIRALEAREKPSAMERSWAEANLDAARTKLRLLGILPEQIQEMEKTRKTSTWLTIFAPIGGTVIEKNVRAGQYVKEGDMLYRIADLDPLWLYLEIYEYDLAWVRFGQQVEVTVEAFPGETFDGTVVFLDPFLDDKTRTVKVRVNLKNPERKLRPAMYASAVLRVRLRADGTPEPTGLEGKYVCPMHPEVVREQPGRCSICAMPLERVPELRGPSLPSGPAPAKEECHEHEAHDSPEQVLAVPASAVLDTGKRKVVYRRTADGAYELVEPELGPRAEAPNDAGQRIGYYAVRSGLKAGDRVVVRGGFLLDSQTQIEGKPSLLYPKGQSAAQLHSGHGDMPKPPSKGEGHKH